MEITYSSKLVGVKKVPALNGLNEVIISIDLVISILADGVVKFNWALADVPVDTPIANTFTPYENLTEEQILSWINNSSVVIGAKDSLRRGINELFTQKEYVAWNDLPTLLEMSQEQQTML
jgi:hypothetical protein